MTQYSRLSFVFIFLLIFVVKISGQPKQVDLRPKIERIINKLKKEDQLHLGYQVGFSSKFKKRNKYYKLYLKLNRIAKNEELNQLTNHSSKCIVVYSFIILKKKKYSKLKEIFIQHQKDSAFFWTAGGCTGIVDQVNMYMLSLLKPEQNESILNYMTKEEYDFFCAKFKKEYSNFTCRE